MNELLQSVGLWPLLFVAVVVYGAAPGFVIRVLSLAFRKNDPRRKEMIAELYAVPRLERLIWVGEQFERAITEGIWERFYGYADGRLFNRWHLGDGIERNREAPDTFWIPTTEEKKNIIPGDFVKVMFEDKNWGERMWIKVTSINGDRFKGTLANEPAGFNLKYGRTIKFRSKHIIDFDLPRDGHDCVCGTECSCSEGYEVA